MKEYKETSHNLIDKSLSDLELSACIQTEHKSQDLQISRIDVQPKTLPEGQTTGTIRLVFSFPATDISGRWYPICQFDRSVKADWYAPLESMTASSAPVVCFLPPAAYLIKYLPVLFFLNGLPDRELELLF